MVNHIYTAEFMEEAIRQITEPVTRNELFYCRKIR